MNQKPRSPIKTGVDNHQILIKHLMDDSPNAQQCTVDAAMHSRHSNAQLHSNDSRRLRITPDDSYRLIATQKIDDSEERGGV